MVERRADSLLRNALETWLKRLLYIFLGQAELKAGMVGSYTDGVVARRCQGIDGAVHGLRRGEQKYKPPSLKERTTSAFSHSTAYGEWLDA